MKQLSKKIIIGVILIFISLKGFSQNEFKHSVYPSETYKEINTDAIHIKGAVTFFGHKRSVVIQNLDDIYTFIRKGTNPDLCKKIFQELDINNKTVIGLNIKTNSSEKPKIINHKVYFDKKENVINVYIDFEDDEIVKGQKFTHPYWFIIPSVEKCTKVIYHIGKFPKQSVM